MFLILFLLFTALPALELFLLIEVGQILGTLNTILLIIATGVVGASLAKSQGMAILSKIQIEMSKGLLPAKELLSGLCVFASGLLLITPGVVTDIVGLLLVIPLTRTLFVAWLASIASNMVKSGNVKFYHYSNGSYQESSRQQERPLNDEPRQVAPNVFEVDFKKKK